MISQHFCPCCASTLLRHISCHRIYWFCGYCHQEMPVIENAVDTKVTRQLGIRQVTTFQQWLSGLPQPENLFPTRETVGLYDSLTQLANHHHFEIYLEQEWRRMAREEMPLSLILCDIDFFRNYNNIYGEATANQCLEKVAQVIATTLNRPTDLVTAYGGDKFAIILPNTKAKVALRVAEAIRTAIQNLHVTQNNVVLKHNLTLSAGVASMIPSHEYSPAMLITAADKALYQAKIQGCDSVILHEQLLRQTQLSESNKTLALR